LPADIIDLCICDCSCIICQINGEWILGMTEQNIDNHGYFKAEDMSGNIINK